MASGGASAARSLLNAGARRRLRDNPWSSGSAWTGGFFCFRKSPRATRTLQISKQVEITNNYILEKVQHAAITPCFASLTRKQDLFGEMQSEPDWTSARPAPPSISFPTGFPRPQCRRSSLRLAHACSAQWRSRVTQHTEDLLLGAGGFARVAVHAKERRGSPLGRCFSAARRMSVKRSLQLAR